MAPTQLETLKDRIKWWRFAKKWDKCAVDYPALCDSEVDFLKSLLPKKARKG